MLVMLPIACWFLLCFARGSRLGCWRLGFIQASLIWATFAVCLTELLSVFTELNRVSVSIAWGCALCICVAFALRDRASLTRPQFKLPQFKFSLPLALLSVLATALGFLAIYCPPNNYDSLTYHLSRIEHWISNESVAHYQIHVLRQLTLNPGAEFLVMQLRLLSSGDYFDNLVQWFSMIGSVLGVSLLAKQLGADERGQILAAAICMTIPIGLLESTSTQNDFVTAFWFVCFLLTLKGLSSNESALWCGLSLGLCLLTKATAFFFVSPFIAIGLVHLWKQFGSGAALRSVTTIAVLSAVLVGPFFFRNIAMFGAPLINKCNYGEGYTAKNEVHSASYLASNMLRNVAIELFTPIPLLNKVIVGAVQRAHGLMHCDVSDPKSTFEGITFDVTHPAFQLHEDVAGNPIHTCLFFAALGIMLLSRQAKQRKTLLIFAGLLALGFVCFSAVLKWQPWHTRLLLPLYVAGSAFIACAFNRLPVRMNSALLYFLLVYSLPYIFLNPSKTILGDENIFTVTRDANYFRGVPNYYASYTAATNFLKDKRAARVGVVAQDNSWAEYPLWVLLSQNFTEPVRVIGLSPAEWKQYGNEKPDALICYDREPPDTIPTQSGIYRRSLICNSVGDRVTYHFFGRAIGKTYSHLNMAVYLPDRVPASPSHQVESL